MKLPEVLYVAIGEAEFWILGYQLGEPDERLK
jgi:hypothetical protein